MKHYPKTLRLLTGTDVKVVKVWYPMGKNTYRVEYEHKGTRRGCLAELFNGRFEKVIPKSYKEQTNG